jgi:uncharacterized protein YjbI with pentapeptide repeats
MPPAARAPVVDEELQEVELDGLVDDDEWVERHLRGEAMGAEAERVGLVRCRLTGVRLAGVRLVRPELVDVVLVDCDLAGVTFEDASLTRVAFTRCRLTGADLGGSQMTDVRFTDCRLDDAGLRMVEAARLVVEGCTAPRLDLYRAKVGGSRWVDGDLTAADLSGADLTGARLGDLVLADVKGGAALRGTVIAPSMAVAVGMALLADAGIEIADDGA